MASIIDNARNLLKNFQQPLTASRGKAINFKQPLIPQIKQGNGLAQQAARYVAPQVPKIAQNMISRVTAPPKQIGTPLNTQQPILPQLGQRLNQAPIIGGIRQFNQRLGPSGFSQFVQGISSLSKPGPITTQGINVGLTFGPGNLKLPGSPKPSATGLGPIADTMAMFGKKAKTTVIKTGKGVLTEEQISPRIREIYSDPESRKIMIDLVGRVSGKKANALEIKRLQDVSEYYLGPRVANLKNNQLIKVWDHYLARADKTAIQTKLPRYQTLVKDDQVTLGGVNSQTAGQLGNKSSSQVGPAIGQTTPIAQKTGPAGVLPEAGISPQGQKVLPPNSSPPSDNITDPVQKIIQALKEAKPIRGAQEALYRADRAKRVARASAVGQKVGGEQGYYAQLGSLKGEMRKVEFEGIRNKLTTDDINSVFQKVEDVPYFSTFEKITAKTGLAKLLGKEGGAVPNKSELTLLNEIFPPEFIQAAQGNKTALQKIMGGIGQVLALPRSLMAGGLDMSYGLRQGIFSGYRHPKQWARAFGTQFKTFGSDKNLKALNESIKAHPNYKLAREAGVSLTDLGAGRLNPREEQFQSQLAEKIPGIGAMVKASGRAYTGFANKYRFDMFNDLVAQAKKTGDFDDPNFLKSAGELVNTLTGRGHLGRLENSAGVLSTTLFSPRLLASRLQLMNPQFYMKLQPLARRRALESLVAYAAGTATILGAAKLSGADVGTDPTSSDFAKIKIGNTRVDIMGGFQQPIVLLARLITGKLTSSTTGKTMILGEGYKAATRFDIIQRFFESKEAPIVSFITSAIKGKDAIGNDFNLPAEVINRMVPMFISDMVELYKDGGLSALPLGIPAFFGTGNQTYGKTELVTGKNQLGEPTSQIRPLQGLGETVAEKVFGQRALGGTSSTNVASYYDQMLKMPREEAAAKFDEISKTNPDLAKKVLQVYKDRKMGITVDDQVIKAKGVASGDRAVAVVKEFNKLQSQEEKAALWDHYVKIGIINKDVAKQMKVLMQKQ